MGEQADVGDGELVRRARAGDSPAFAQLVRKYRRAAYSVALSVTGSHEDAEDVAQESFVVALERLEECRKPDRFSSWFLTIVRNRGRNTVRREKLRQGDPIPFGLATTDPGPARRMEWTMLREQLRAAMTVLSQVQREVVLLHDLEGWKHREIAQHLDLPSGTVRSHLHHARKRLRRELSSSSALGGEEKRTG